MQTPNRILQSRLVSGARVARWTHFGTALALAPAAQLSASQAAVIPKDVIRPEPGLYRVDIDGQFGAVGEDSSVTHKQDGATGDATGTSHVRGRKTSKTIKGTGEKTHCFKHNSDAEAVKLLPLMPLACKQNSLTEMSDGVIIKSTCQFGKGTYTIRKLGQGRWEFLTDTTFGGANSSASYAFLAPLLQMQTENARTQAERDKAAKMLAGLPAMQKELTQANQAWAEQLRAEAAKAHSPAEKARLLGMIDHIGGTPVSNSKSRTVMTKISNICQ